MASQKSIEAKIKELVVFADNQKRKAKYWTDLHNAVFGIGGKFGELFPSRRERESALQCAGMSTIHELIDKLPEAPTVKAPKRADVGGKILVRVPKSVHAALLAEAKSENISLNQLILAKLTLSLKAMV